MSRPGAPGRTGAGPRRGQARCHRRSLRHSRAPASAVTAWRASDHATGITGHPRSGRRRRPRRAALVREILAATGATVTTAATALAALAALERTIARGRYRAFSI